MENLLPVFIGLTGAAVLLQAGLLAAMYLTMRKTSAKMEAIADEMKGKILPAIDVAQGLLTDLRPLFAELAPMLAEIRPKVNGITENIQESTSVVRAQVERVEATVDDIVDRARLQVIRTDELVTRTLDRVERTTDMVHHTVVSPIRQVSGLVKGLTVGIEVLLGNRAHRNGGGREPRRPVPQDEMFI